MLARAARQVMLTALALLAPVAWAGPFQADERGAWIETPRYRVRFERGCVTEVHSKLDGVRYTRGEALALDDAAFRFGLLAIKQTTAPEIMGPQQEGCEKPTDKSKVAVEETPAGLTIKYTGLHRPAGDINLPQASIQAKLSIEEATGDLLMTMRGEGAYNTTGVALGLTNLDAAHEYLAPAREGLLLDKTVPDGAEALAPWWMGVRFAPSLIIGRTDKGAFMLWNQDPSMPYTPIYYLKRGGMYSFFFETRNQFPWYNTDAAQSVVWRFNTFPSWQEAVRRYSRWLEEGAGFVPLGVRPPKWAADIYFISSRPFTFEPAVAACKAMFEDPSCVLIYGVDMTEGTGANRANFVAYKHRANLVPDIQLAHKAGMKTQLYSYYNIVWNWPETVDAFNKYKYLRVFLPFNPGWGRFEYGYYNVNPASDEFRKALVQRHVELIRQTGADGFYLDTAFCQGLEGPLVDGHTTVEGQRLFQKEVSEALPDVATEAEFTTPSVIHPARGHHFTMTYGSQLHEYRLQYEAYRLYADHPFPITSLIWGRFVKMHGLDHQVTAQEGEPGHWLRDFYERTGMCELTYVSDGYAFTGKMAAAPGGIPRLLREHVNLFGKRRLKIHLRDDWPREVRSFYKAKDGAVFAFKDIPGGSALVEQQPAGETAHYARIRGDAAPPAGLGMSGWPCVDAAGRPAALNPAKWYCLFRQVEAPPVRVTGLPNGVYLDAWRVADAACVLDFRTADGQPKDIQVSVEPAKGGEVRVLTEKEVLVVAQGRAFTLTVPGPLVLLTGEPRRVMQDISLLTAGDDVKTLPVIGSAYEGYAEAIGQAAVQRKTEFAGAKDALSLYIQTGFEGREGCLAERTIVLDEKAALNPELVFHAGGYGSKPYVIDVLVNGRAAATIKDDGKDPQTHRVPLKACVGRPVHLSLRLKAEGLLFTGPVVVLDAKPAGK